MAIAPTGAIYKALSFDGVSSRDFGVYITGEAVYNAPNKEVEMISIPGRNGQFALDKGRFENIEVSYPAGIFADSETDFAEAISNFRNFVCSRQGYVRLTDDYNPNEYRMAVYISGLEVTPALLKAGEFTITFNCKPQRWLTSGETAVEVESGDVLTNPTSFEAQPVLEVDGYGTISFNGYDIEIEDGGTVGEIEVARNDYDEARGTAQTLSCRHVIRPDMSLVRNGDRFYTTFNTSFWVGSATSFSASDLTTTSTEGIVDSLRGQGSSTGLYIYVDFTEYFWNFYKGTDTTLSGGFTATLSKSGTSATITVSISIVYNASDSTITFDYSASLTNVVGDLAARFIYLENGLVMARSTMPILGLPLYIDCDLGEAYKIEDGEVVPLNRYIDLGSGLPRLAPGANAITFDNTVNELKVKPNWWKV